MGEINVLFVARWVETMVAILKSAIWDPTFAFFNRMRVM